MPEHRRILFVALLASAASAQQFAASQPPGLGLASSFDFFSQAAVGDFDGDGDDDVVLASLLGLRLLQNDGAGAWTDVSAALPTISAPLLSVSTLRFVDVNGDGRQELLVTGYGLHLLLGYTPAGTWTDLSAGLPAGLLPTRLLAGDFDGDGDLDLAGAGFSLAGSANVLLVNQGSGTFVASNPFPGYDRAIAAGDIDGDGDLDLLLGGNLWRNDGALVFTNVTASQLPSATGVDVTAFGDVDGDGDLDLVVGSTAANDATLLRNAGNGFFTSVPGAVAAQAGANRFVALADVDGDGDLDLLRTSLGSPPLLSRNVGGVFVDDPAALPAAAAVNAQLLLADIDHDGDVDVVWLPVQAPALLLSNRHRQLVVPQPPQIGQTWNVEIWSEPGYAVGPRQALLGIALVRLPQPLSLGPWGRLWLDLSFPYQLEAPMLQPGPGPTVLSFLIPNAPAIQGVALHLQTLIGEIPGQPEPVLTGVVTSVIQ
jgi:hypothetical protein